MAERDDLKPWDRQPGETSKAYAHFQVFLDMGADRTLQKVADTVAKSEQYIRRLSVQYGWQDRARAWDSMPRRATAQAYEDMAREIAEQHRRLATKLVARLDQNLDLLPTGADPSIKWSTAHSAARQGHAFAADLSKPAATQAQEITSAIENLLNKLAGE